jgi:hypothetical protein
VVILIATPNILSTGESNTSTEEDTSEQGSMLPTKRTQAIKNWSLYDNNIQLIILEHISFICLMVS